MVYLFPIQPIVWEMGILWFPVWEMDPIGMERGTLSWLMEKLCKVARHFDIMQDMLGLSGGFWAGPAQTKVVKMKFFDFSYWASSTPWGHVLSLIYSFYPNLTIRCQKVEKRVSHTNSKLLVNLTFWKTEYLIAQLRTGIWRKVIRLKQ